MIAAHLAAAGSGQLPKIPPDWPGWLIIAVILLVVGRFVLKLLGIIK